tara:strand:- start:613 stop:1011 length:399 start_codon:yes stop_codon:yes gene_type:complete
MNYQIENVIIVYGFVLVFWISLTIWREMNKRDVKILRKELFGLNGWSLLHFINYIFLGYLAPDYVIVVIILGAIFEIMEIPLGMYISKYIDAKFVKDTLVNSVGVISGYLIYKKYPKKVRLRNLMNKMFVHF